MSDGMMSSLATSSGFAAQAGSQAQGPGRQEATDAVAQDKANFREAMGIAVRGLAFEEALPRHHESPSRAIARRLPGSPENADAMMKEVRADMEAWQDRRDAARKQLQQLDAMTYRS
jgi:UDP-N-acetyl-D-mannosaminuronate dehydrogenase